MILSDIIILTIFSLLIVLLILSVCMDLLLNKRQNEIHEKIDNWIVNFWK